VNYLTPLVFLLIYPVLKMVHDDRRAAGDDGISGLELMFWVSIGVLAVCLIAVILGF
jgi:hypothetical protein